MVVCGADILLELSQRYGIEYIFGSPGSEWVPVWESLARRYGQGEKTPKYINCRHEILAVSMAMGYTKATGHISAVLLHASVGPLNSAMAIRAAYRDRVPMVICSADTSCGGEDVDTKGWGWHWLNLLSDVGGPSALLRPYVKWSNAVTSREALMDSVSRGYQIAQTAPQGPVFLAISKELLLKSTPEVRTAGAAFAAALSEPSPSDIKQVANLLVESGQPIIITEYAGKRPENVGKLTELAELLSIPVFECINPTFTNFPKNHALHMGYDASEALQEADTVLVVGGTTPWYPPPSFPQNGARVVFLDEEPLKEYLPYWGYQADLLLTADIGQGLSALVNAIRNHVLKPESLGSRYRRKFQRWRNKHEQIARQWKAEAIAGEKNKPISPKWFLYMVNKVLPSNSIIVEETITHMPLVLRYLTETNGYFRTSGGLGIGLGMAVGAKLAYHNRPIILLVGDGSFNYNPVLAGLGVCQEYHLPVLVIVLNNGGYMTMKRGYQNHYPKGWAVSNHAYLGVNISPAPAYTKVAEALDAYGERLEDPDNIESALNRALQQIALGRAGLLDVVLESE